MQVGKVQQQITFGTVYKVPKVKSSDIEYFEEIIASKYRKYSKQSIMGIDMGKDLYVLTQKDAVEFDRYYSHIKKEKLGFYNVLLSETSRRLYNIVSPFSNVDFKLVNDFLHGRNEKNMSSFAELVITLLDK